MARMTAVAAVFPQLPVEVPMRRREQQADERLRPNCHWNVAPTPDRPRASVTHQSAATKTASEGQPGQSLVHAGPRRLPLPLAASVP